MNRDTSRLSSRLRWMPLLGLVIGGMFGARGLLLPHPFAPIGPGQPSEADVFCMFAVGGAIGGALVAALFPMSRWLFGSTLLGIVGVAPGYLGVFLVDRAGFHSLLELLIEASILIVLIGGYTGFSAWIQGHTP